MGQSQTFLSYRSGGGGERNEMADSRREKAGDEGHMVLRARKRGREGGDATPPPATRRGGGGSAAGSRRRGRDGGEESPPAATRQRGSAGRSRLAGRAIVGCSSPRTAFITRLSEFSCYEEDVWTEVAKYLDGQSLMRLGLVNRWFRSQMEEECIWRYACLRDLQVPRPRYVSFKWRDLYSSAFDGSHSYCFRQQEKHIDWMRIGAFFFNSPVALLTEKLPPPLRVAQLGEDPERAIQMTGTCLVNRMKTGIWIADLQLVRCPVCNLDTCEGTMQILDARHSELFLEEGYKKGTWEYEDIGCRRSEKHSATATGGIFDVRHISAPCSASVLNVKSWMGKEDDWQPKARVCPHGVAINTNLQANEGINVKFQVMRNGAPDGEIVSVRISQQLI